MEKTIYGFTARNSAGKEILFDQFRDKVLLIVNTASGCGHTPQLAELEEIYQRYKNSGLIILGFPTDQFSQEPLEGKAIDEFCSVNYGVTFPIMEKGNIKGEHAHPLFQFFADKKQNGKIKSSPYWNFYKYLIGRDGKVIDYFFTYRHPTNRKITRAIEKALSVKTTSSNTALSAQKL
ncbi:MAG: glutathione peroxidase [Bacteroidetes bacterium]|nr:glutathione peroxidase [Bacteroidota bacterium]MBP9796273.1 glutathione peroxidase [Chitinophagales bacterium]